MVTLKDKPQKIKVVGTGVSVELAPGETLPVEIPREAIPRYGIVQMMRQADGSYLPVLLPWGKTVRMHNDIGRKELGVDISYKTLMRLGKAQFIRIYAIAPQAYELDLKSFYDHIEAVQDPEFWTPERRQLYIDARYFGGSAS